MIDIRGGMGRHVSRDIQNDALAPELAYLKFRAGSHDGLMVNLFETSHAVTNLDGRAVTLEQRTAFPREGSATLTVHTPHPATFALRVRSPAWAAPLVVRVGSEEVHGPKRGWAEVSARKWNDGDQVKVTRETKTKSGR